MPEKNSQPVCKKSFIEWRPGAVQYSDHKKMIVIKLLDETDIPTLAVEMKFDVEKWSKLSNNWQYCKLNPNQDQKIYEMAANHRLFANLPIDKF